MERIFYKKLVNRIYGYKMVTTDAEFNELKNEVSDFTETLKNLPVSEAHKKFYEKYGELVTSAKTQEQIELQKKIVAVLGFFKVLAILLIVLSIINVILSLV